MTNATQKGKRWSALLLALTAGVAFGGDVTLSSTATRDDIQTA